MDDLTEEDQARLFADPATGFPAPMVLRRPMLRLAGPTPNVVAVACSMSNADDLTTWKVLWLTEALVVFGEASASGPTAWTATSADQRPDRVAVRAWSLRDVRSVEAVELSVTKDWEGEWSWRERYEVAFSDDSVRLPFFADHPAGVDGQRPALELLSQLTARL